MSSVRCMQARKATHCLDGQHQDVDRTLRGRVSQNDRGQGQMEKVRPWCGQPSDRGRLKNRIEQNRCRASTACTALRPTINKIQTQQLISVNHVSVIEVIRVGVLLPYTSANAPIAVNSLLNITRILTEYVAALTQLR